VSHRAATRTPPVIDAAVADAVLDGIDVGIVACDAAGRLTVVNRTTRELFAGHGPDSETTPEATPQRFSLFRADGVTLLPPEEVPLYRTLREGNLSGVEIVVAPPGSPVRRLWCTGRTVQESDGTLAGAVVAMRDVTEQRETERLLRESAQRDPLTSLLNRSAVTEALARALTAPDTAVALLFVDLDGFKSVNDRFGHAAGDTLLRQVALRLSAACRRSERVGRLGGDEFVIACPGLAPQGQGYAAELAARVVLELSRPFLVDGVRVRVSASVGIAFSEPGLQPLELLARADDAMYRAKRAGKNRWCAYTAQTEEQAQCAWRVERLLRASLDDGTFEVHYQPLYDLRTGAIIGAEALARVPDGDGGWISPELFIPVAENTGLIGRLGQTVMEMALRQTVTWKAGLGAAQFGIGVNLSVRQLGDPQLLRKVTTLLEQTGLPPDALVLELTESIFSDDRQHEHDLAALRRLGIKVFIDDFGTGYSSLSYLRRFDVDGLKIDKMFVRDLVDDERDRHVTRAIVQMAFDLGIAVVAEGIETPEQLEVVVEALGCSLGQGYLLSRPVRPDAFTQLLGQQLAA